MKIRNHNGVQPLQLQSKQPVKLTKVNKKRVGKDITMKQNIPPNNQEIKKKKQSIHCNIVTRSPKNMHNIDENNQINEYQGQIIEYLKNKQNDRMIDINELRKNQSMSRKVRAFVVKFFYKIKINFKLKRKTMHLAVFYLDLYLQKNERVDKKELVIFSQAALWIAMKYQEIYPPELYQWVSKSKIKSVLKAESQILFCLDFNVTLQTRQTFLQYYLVKYNIDRASQKMIKVLLDLTLFDEGMYRYKMEQITKSIIFSVISPKKIDQRSDMVIKWMIQRNQSSLEWLQQHFTELPSQ